MEKELLTTQQVLDILGVSKVWFNKKIKKKYNLVAVDNVGKNKLVYDFEDIERIRQQENPCNVLREYYGY